MAIHTDDARLSPVRKMLLVARNGHEALYGSDLEPVMRAVAQGMPPYGAPAVNTEVPLVGPAGSDVHVRCSHRHFHGTGEPQAGMFWDEHPRLLAWAKNHLKSGEGIGVSYDVRSPGGHEPAVYLKGTSARSFFEALGAPDAVRVHNAAVGRLPHGWRCWYTGLFPNREGCPVRLGIVLTREVQDAYAGNPHRLEADFAAAGVHGMGSSLVGFLAQQAALPHLFDVELDVRPNGTVGWPVGVNLTLRLAGDEAHEAVASGNLHDLLVQAEEAGLADGRWRQVGDAAFRRLVPSARVGGVRGLVACENRLVYLKLRFQGSRPLDAKAYYQTIWRPI